MSGLFTGLRILNKSHDIGQSEELVRDHCIHLVELIPDDKIFDSVHPGMLSHIDDREVNALHLGVEPDVIFLIRVQDDAWLLSPRSSLVVDHLCAKSLPVEDFAKELNPLLEILIEQLIAGFLHILLVELFS